MEDLTEQERAVLAFEALGWHSPDAKAQAIKDAWGISSVRYEQWLARIIQLPAALQAHPVLVHRLQRLSEARRQARKAS